MSQVARGGSDQQLAVIKKMKEDPSNIKSISSFVTDFTLLKLLLDTEIIFRICQG